MAHLIDKDALVAEIESKIKKLRSNLEICKTENDRKTISLYIGCYNGILSILDTLEVKEVDLDNFVKEEFNKYSCVDGYGQLSVSYNMAEFYGMIKRLTKAQKGE